MPSPARILSALRLRLRSFIVRLSARADTRRRLARPGHRRVLVVCYGNIYRSAFVGALLREALPSPIEVRSTGFHAVSGRRSPERHVEMSKRWGVCLEDHRSSVISRADLDWADVVVLMDRHNWAALDALGASPEKLLWLGALAPGPVEIEDPYNLSDSRAAELLARMHTAARHLAHDLEESAHRALQM